MKYSNQNHCLALSKEFNNTRVWLAFGIKIKIKIKMNTQFVQKIVLGIILSLTAQHSFAEIQQIVTTDSDNCLTDNYVVAVRNGTSQAVIDTSIPNWQALGFSIGSIKPDQDIITCTYAPPPPDQVITPEQEGLDQGASVATIAIDASVIQSANIFTRLATYRDPHNLPNANRINNHLSGGGASADQPFLLDQRLNFFVNGTGNFGDQQATQRSNGFDFDTAGVIVGTDYRFTNSLVIGTAFGYTSSHSNMNKGLGNLDSDNYSLSLFGSYSLPSNFYVDGLVRVGWSTYNSQRNYSTAATPNIIESAAADYNGNDYAVSFSTGYSHNINALTLRPFLRYDYIHIDIDGYQETGNASNLSTIDTQHINSMRTALGGELSYTISTPYAVFIPLVRAEWQHEFMNDSRLLTSSLSNASGIITQLQTNTPDRDFANLGFGFSTVFPHGVSGFFYYEVMLANRLTTAHAFNGGIRIEF
jgi:outer membrane autotransporter protein